MPLPAAEELAPRNEAERRAGAVVLEFITEISGTLDLQGKDSEGEVRRVHRFRYLVFDKEGAERLTSHAFFEREAEDTATSISGRTITPDGEILPIDPEKDVRNLDTRDAEGKSIVSRRTVFFPRVQPGAILDLSYATTLQRLPSLEVVTLQLDLPVREAIVRSTGTLQRTESKTNRFLGVTKVTAGVYWVPFFLGPAPPNAAVNVEKQFSMNLRATDLPPLVEEPFSPPSRRRAYAVGFVPRTFFAKPRISTELWRENLLILGTPPPTFKSVRGSPTRWEIDSDRGIVQLDELGLQPLPFWMGGSHQMLEPFQNSLEEMNQRITRFMKQSPGGKRLKEIGPDALEDLGWKERARRIYDFVRTNVEVDPNAGDASSPSGALGEGRANGVDVTLLLASLLEQAGVPSRLLYALNRYASPFQPAVWRWGPFLPLWMVEAGPTGESHLFLAPSDRFATFDALPVAYLGSLAFARPAQAKSPWPIVRIPADLVGMDSTRVACEAPLDPGGGEVELTLRVEFAGASSSTMRRLFEPTRGGEAPDDAEKQRIEALRALADRWTNAEYTGGIPGAIGESSGVEPFRLDLRMAWRPASQDLGGRVLFPAFASADLFRNLLTQPERIAPLWLWGGSYELSMEWRLPEGAALESLPERLTRNGPGGLAMDVWVESPAPRTAISRMRLHLPYMLPASDYPAVKAFFEELQRAGSTRLLAVIRPGS